MQGVRRVLCGAVLREGKAAEGLEAGALCGARHALHERDGERRRDEPMNAFVFHHCLHGVRTIALSMAIRRASSRARAAERPLFARKGNWLCPK